MDIARIYTHYPFKFNPIWLKDKGFCSFVHYKWYSLNSSRNSSLLLGFSRNMPTLKSEVCLWEKEKKKESSEELSSL